MLGECDRIVVEYIINVKCKCYFFVIKKCVLVIIRVRGYEGGYIWRFWMLNIIYISECVIKLDVKYLELEI